jgi:branched-chain amino acid transport system ATP-binding protein
MQIVMRREKGNLIPDNRKQPEGLDALLTLINVDTVFNHAIHVLKGISMVVNASGVTAILGANGAGKTTTLKTITGWIRQQNGRLEKGQIFLGDERIDHREPDAIVRLGLALVPEGRRVFPDLTVKENLMIGAYTRCNVQEIRKSFEKMGDYFPVLSARHKQRAGLLSGGEQQMLAVCRGLMSRPRMLCLDEPSLGLAPKVTAHIYTILKRINQEERVALLLVEQNAGLALDFSQYGYILENGKVVLDGPSDRLKENVDVKEFYLGLTEEANRKCYSAVKHYKRRKRWLS